jgi:iron complex transport system substrate-binding protein
MSKRVILTLLITILTVTPLAGISQAQDGGLSVIAPTAQQAVIEAWAGAFDGADLSLTFVETEADVLAGAADADLVFSAGMDLEVANCALSRAYSPLPDVYAYALGCGAEIAPAALDFLKFVISPDGQQIAIDLGLLPDSVEVIDQAGETVTVSQPVRHIAAAYGVATFYVYALDASDQLVAAAYLAVRKPPATEIMARIDPDFERISTAVSVIGQEETNIEELASLEPDLILASARTQWLETAAELGISIIRFEGESPELLKQAMTMLGAVLGPNAAFRAAQYNAYYDRVLGDILAQTESIDPKLKVYMSGTEPLRVASGDMYQTAMIEAAGGVSVSADLTGFWTDVNLEQVATWNPDVIFFVPYGGANAEAFTESPEWAIIPAVEAGRVYRVPNLTGPWDAPIPDSILGIIWMAQTLYPDQVAYDCATEATVFYHLFYDYAIPAEEAQAVCQ